MKKSVAIGIAGVAAIVVAAWRQVQHDNTLDSDSEQAAATAPSPVSPMPDALFESSVSEKSTKAELYEIATELEIEGRSKMNKSELLVAIRAAS